MRARVDHRKEDGRPLVGRQAELALLTGALGRACNGRAQLVAVAGEPGIGKSRLLAELAREAVRRGVPVLTARAAEFESEAPMGVVVNALDDHTRTLGRGRLEKLDPTFVSLLGEIFPALARQEAQRGPAPVAERYQLHRAVRALLEEVAVPDGLVLLLDDLHWADAASVDLLCHLLRHPPRAGVLIALSFRPRQVAARLASSLTAAVRDDQAQHLELDPLSLEEAGELLGPRISRSWRQTIYEASGGNPLYLEALAALEGDVNRLATPGAIDMQGGEVPHVVRAALSAEIDALSALGGRWHEPPPWWATPSILSW